MIGKITYTPFVSKRIPESSALSPIPISLPISEYRGADPNREVIPIQYAPTTSKKEGTKKDESDNLEFSRLVLSSRSKDSHQYKSSDIKTGNMQGFLDEAAKHGIYFRITSGVREDAATSKGNRSNHATGNAIDITPLEGQS